MTVRRLAASNGLLSRHRHRLCKASAERGAEPAAPTAAGKPPPPLGRRRRAAIATAALPRVGSERRLELFLLATRRAPAVGRLDCRSRALARRRHVRFRHDAHPPRAAAARRRLQPGGRDHAPLLFEVGALRRPLRRALLFRRRRRFGSRRQQRLWRLRRRRRRRCGRWRRRGRRRAQQRAHVRRDALDRVEAREAELWYLARTQTAQRDAVDVLAAQRRRQRRHVGAERLERGGDLVGAPPERRRRLRKLRRRRRWRGPPRSAAARVRGARREAAAVGMV